MDVKGLWESTALVAALAQVQSGWIDCTYLNKVVVSRTATGGTYVFEVDWSSDGVTVDNVETVTTTEGDQVDQTIAGKYARFRVKNTHATVAFSAHHTSVVGQSGQ